MAIVTILLKLIPWIASYLIIDQIEDITSDVTNDGENPVGGILTGLGGLGLIGILGILGFIYMSRGK